MLKYELDLAVPFNVKFQAWNYLVKWHHVSGKTGYHPFVILEKPMDNIYFLLIKQQVNNDTIYTHRNVTSLLKNTFDKNNNFVLKLRFAPSTNKICVSTLIIVFLKRDCLIDLFILPLLLIYIVNGGRYVPTFSKLVSSWIVCANIKHVKHDNMFAAKICLT